MRTPPIFAPRFKTIKMRIRDYLILIVAAAMSSCGERKGSDRVIHSVMTVKPASVNGETVKRFAGIVKENAEISLGFKTAGQIVQILVKEGDHVRKGQLLARLDAKDYQLGVDATQIQYNQLKSEVTRLRQLYEGKSLSANDYEKAVSGLNQLGVQLQANKNKLDYTRLYAPQDALVQSIHFERSEMVDAGTPVFTLLDTHRMEVEVSLPVSVCEMRSRFGSISCTCGGQTYPLQLINILPKADSHQLHTARFAISGNPTAGLNVDVTIPIAATSKAGRYTIPPQAVFEDGGKPCVWVVSNHHTVNRREVAIGGVDDEGHLVITSGLTGSETVVRAGVGVLHDKEQVKIIGETSITNIGGLI